MMNENKRKEILKKALGRLRRQWEAAVRRRLPVLTLLSVCFVLLTACGGSGAGDEQSDTLEWQQEKTESTVREDGTGQGGTSAAVQETETDVMEVHFIDAGQGDATLITCGRYSMLIDTGLADNGTALQNYLQKQGIERLDYLVLTHPDSDHIGGAPVILTKFEIGQVLVSNYEKDNKTYRKLMQALDDKRLKAVTPQVGSVFTLGSAECTVLAPNDTYDDPNNASIALMVKNGENSFLFTGDAEKKAEKDILKNGLPLQAQVYKAGHHGSRSSSTEDFLDAVAPEYAVISCGEDNSKGHPHAATLNNLRARGVKVYRTDEQGSLTAISDGSVITWNAAPSETWKAGEPTGSGKQETSVPQPAADTEQTALTYVLNSDSKKFHLPSCDSLPTANRVDTDLSREEIIEQGYVPCKKCNP